MLVLGIDPGLTRCGVGAVSGAPGQVLKLVDVGVIRSSAELPVEFRLLEISNGLIEWIEKIKPDSIAVERVFAQENRASAMETAQAAGIALLLAAQRNIPVALHTPTEVKAAVTGSGVAGKPQVGEMVKRLLILDEIPKPADSADALALAICHIIRAPMKARIESARLR
jgi:crossover junction endodeoxyribonuclease RuvC